MIRSVVKKLSNPRKVVRAHRRPKQSARKKRRMSPKQIRIFGTKRQKAALKVAMKRKRMKSNPRRVTSKRTASHRRTKRVHNPALIVTLGAVNPRRRKPVAAKKTKKRRAKAVQKRRTTKTRRVVRRRRNPVAHRRRRRSNSAKKVIIRYRNRKHRRNTSRRHRRNPTLFGSSIMSSGGLKIVGGALAGVVVAKFAPTLLPTTMLGSLGGSNVGKVVITGASAVAGAWLISKWDRSIGEAALLGGLMQTASVALNAFLPSVYQSLGIGLGDLMPGSFPVPQNPLRLPPPPAPMPTGGSQVRMAMNGLTRAYGSAF